MATLQLDTLRDIGGSRSQGFISNISRSCQVTGITGTAADTVAGQVFNATNMPLTGSIITVVTNKLYLDDISWKLASGQKTIADVTLDYIRRETEALTGTTPTLRGGTALKQVQTYRVDNARMTRDLDVEHTWPAGDDRAGKTEIQGGSISVLIPMSTLYGEVTIATDVPGTISTDWTGHINDASWQGREAHTWMCTACEFDVIDVETTPHTYRFAFTFEYDRNTWDNDTTIVFIDPRTSKPVSPLVEGESRWQVPYYPTRNFSNTF